MFNDFLYFLGTDTLVSKIAVIALLGIPLMGLATAISRKTDHYKFSTVMLMLLLAVGLGPVIVGLALIGPADDGYIQTVYEQATRSQEVASYYIESLEHVRKDEITGRITGVQLDRAEHQTRYALVEDGVEYQHRATNNTNALFESAPDHTLWLITPAQRCRLATLLAGPSEALGSEVCRPESETALRETGPSSRRVATRP